MRLLRLPTLALLTFLNFSVVQAEALETKLAVAGSAAMPVIVGEKASEATRTAATDLAKMLQKISGGKFEVKAGDGRTGIAVGTVSDFSKLGFASEFDLQSPLNREDYLLRSHAGGLYVLGATDAGVSHAVWDLLYRLGYRHYFPGENWEIVPTHADLSLGVDTKQHPDYAIRRIWYAFGDWKGQLELQQQLPLWNTHNRMGIGIDVHAGHIYNRIIRDHKAEFDRHPEYVCVRKKGNMKFRVSNPGLRKLVVDWALDYFEKNPNEMCVSLEPSDGGGWENAEEAKAFKNISDRVVTLANEVAAAVEKKHKDKYVGIYAYNEHSPPPTIRVHPRVVVFVATGYIKGGYTVEQLMDGWRKQGAVLLGTREYYSIVVKHKERPGGPPAADPHAIAASIVKYYQLGSRFMNSESSNSWGPGGLGHYVASRVMWDVKTDPDAVIADFFEKAFGSAKAPMQEFYRAIDKANSPHFSRHLIGQMYQKLDAARQLTKDSGILGRLDDLTLYTRYCDLLWTLESASKDQKAAASEAVLRFAYRIRKTGMVHALALWRDTRKGFDAVPEEATFRIPEGQNSWKSSEPFTTADIAGFLKQGVASYPVLDFAPVHFSDNLVPATALKLPKGEIGTLNYIRRPAQYEVWFEAPGELKLEVTAGQISAFDANATLSLFGPDASNDKPIATVEVPIDQKPHTISLKSPSRGLHRLKVVERAKGAQLNWPAGTPVAIPSQAQRQLVLYGRNNLCFYVPKGTTTVAGYVHRGTIVNGDGKVVYQSTEPSHFNVPVPPGQAGRVWWLKNATGTCTLLTVPSQFARSSSELLLPKEVVEADAK